jgi:hypothetical protein
MDFINRYIRGVIFSIGLILFIFCAIRMSQLPLWGHLPLGFFIGAWLVIVASLRFFWTDPERKRWFLLSTISGLLLSIGFPPLPFPVILFIAFIPALIVQQQIEASDSKTSVFLYIP